MYTDFDHFPVTTTNVWHIKLKLPLPLYLNSVTTLPSKTLHCC